MRVVIRLMFPRRLAMSWMGETVGGIGPISLQSGAPGFLCSPSGPGDGSASCLQEAEPEGAQEGSGDCQETNEGSVVMKINKGRIGGSLNEFITEQKAKDPIFAE